MTARKTKKKEQTPLEAALAFLKHAQKDIGAPYQTHFRITSIEGKTFLSAYDGFLALGTSIEDDLPDACPHTYRLIHALERAKGQTSVTVQDQSVIVKTSKLRAVVPCIGMEDMQLVFPDTKQWPLNDEFRTAADKAAVLTREGATTVAQASILTRNGTLVGTNGFVLVEAYHGNPTPPDLILPKAFVQALSKIDKRIVGFGFSEVSFTVWFEDDSWLRSQLYVEKWPPIDGILAEIQNAKPEEVPKDFFDGLTTVAAFSDDGHIYCRQDEIASHRDEGVGSTYKCKGVPDGHSFNIRSLSSLTKLLEKMDFECSDRLVAFFGDKVRGAISRRA